ncbi:hypothetical protein EVAR_79673_1 [Eumeta japonica]|uniref:Uncharacterized protein n=1 Tax=Eumeta variegata TaxID=151549 RepID=A0A4C1WCE1_EUMVA|nr:hypothetical protein EVAR_79673_1 [Eumeta japonica]
MTGVPPPYASCSNLCYIRQIWYDLPSAVFPINYGKKVFEKRVYFFLKGLQLPRVPLNSTYPWSVIITYSPVSIETPTFSRLTPKPAFAFNRSIPDRSSPVPPMSPKTIKLLSILESGEDFNSDDSVRNPDYQIDEFNDDGFGDN